jgi:heme-degrading monooxygenase HmoA
MHARMIQLSLKPGKQEEFIKMINERLPAAKQSPGFVDAVALAPENGHDPFVGILFWKSNADAENYLNGAGKQFIEKVKPFAQGEPRFEALHVAASTIRSIEADRAVAAD